MNCNIAGCHKPEHSVGVCRMHYARYEKYGSYELPIKESVVETLLSNRTIDDNGCWLWTKSCGKNGYGQIYIKRNPFAVHRISYETFIGEVPAGLLVLHHCDVKRCFNPQHLHVGTHADNRQEASERDRIAFGTRKPNAVLSESKVISIRQEYAAGGVTQKQLAKKYGDCSQGTISFAITGSTWRRVR